MDERLIPSLKPQKLVKAIAPKRQLISQRTEDRIAKAQEAFKWAKIFGPKVGLKIFDRLEGSKRKADFTKTVTEFLIRIYELKLKHEVIITILKILFILGALIAGALLNFLKQDFCERETVDTEPNLNSLVESGGRSRSGELAIAAARAAGSKLLWAYAPRALMTLCDSERATRVDIWSGNRL